MVQTTEICGHEVSRLIIGGNTISGTSHFNKKIDAELDQVKLNAQYVSDAINKLG